MRLANVHVTNFRSVEDSGECDVRGVVCLVGKNEAGKTAILQALAGLNPHPLTPFSYNLERDYPRRWLTEYAARHGESQATVVSTEWELSENEKAEIRKQTGDGLKDEPVVVYRRYEDKEAQWRFPIDYKRVVQNLIAFEKLDDEESKPLAGAEDSRALRKALEGIVERTNRQEHLLERLNSLPDNCVSEYVKSVLAPLLPRFMYSSHYERMVGELRLDTYNARKQGQQQPGIEPGERVFLDFLEYAGTSVDEIMAANTYETLNARCEAASSRITDQLLEYWSQNPLIEIDVRVTKAEPKDPPPFNQGVIARARVRNNLHKLTLPFSERSAGFVWFFSFLVKFAQVRKTGGNLVLLLDEPGLTLHGKAQSDLLRYIFEKLAPNHQVLFTTHSPFMVPADDLPSIRVVEDRILQLRPGQWVSDGTKIRDDTLAIDRDTLFPLQGALGYEITQTLFVGKHTLLVEGPGDILYLQAWSSALKRRGRPGLDRRWTVCPGGGIDRIQPFVALFAGQKLDIAAITDYSRADKKKVETLLRNRILESERMLTFATLLGRDEADVEDVFSPALYARVLNAAFDLPTDKVLDADRLIKALESTTRLVKKAEAYFAVLPPELPEFDHFTPAIWFFQNPSVLDAESDDVAQTLERAERVISALNCILDRSAAP